MFENCRSRNKGGIVCEGSGLFPPLFRFSARMVEFLVSAAVDADYCLIYSLFELRRPNFSKGRISRGTGWCFSAVFWTGARRRLFHRVSATRSGVKTGRTALSTRSEAPNWSNLFSLKGGNFLGEIFKDTSLSYGYRNCPEPRRGLRCAIQGRFR